MSRLTLASTVKLTSGYQLPLLGLGVYQNDECYPACVAALKHGYRHIDTAQLYRNEAEVGRAVKDSGVPREEIFITSKVIQGSHGYQPALAVVEQSLKLLNTSYIDLYLIHSPLSGKRKRLEAYKALIDKKAEGKIRSIGVSNYGVKHLEEIREAGFETPTVNQVELHPFCQQRPIVNYCNEHNIVIEAYCPLIRGAFNHPVIEEVSKNVGQPPAKVLIRWSLQKGFVPLPKSSKPERVVSNAEVYDFELSESDMKKLDDLDQGDNGAISWNPVNAD